MLDDDPGEDGPAQEAELRALTAAHEAAFAHMTEQLDRADAAVERMTRYFAMKGAVP